ncbi:hypothetical protein ASPZODRAFT_132580 [Penicilliopsis zonata CBS 506.65]|uniref:Uncharacterized protein n=1 Tax=Penicilliopsis zonata CBS 506.65 TaxID=1073090 RepID=A0A1L9SHJ3_9EURO|nr:hypothetical protein ASPZODRAFT_132580 [Penicilliopsis zonata CBS 506.65]OJJ46504.1 hypothetical protein ASPZODRAFT_132580 [Penicilliopsis zonata CBS 506.65]
MNILISRAKYFAPMPLHGGADNWQAWTTFSWTTMCEIWNAIAAVSKLLDWGQKVQRKRRQDQDIWYSRWASLARSDEPSKVKREIIQRFTTVNGDTRERMLAVTRSLRETRFAFHSRDTALL